MNDIFYCYSLRVKTFLCDNGYPFSLTGYHTPSGRRFWGFARGKELDELLKQYSNK